MSVGLEALKHDETLMCVSAWNDNGFKGLVRESKTLQRTSYFPGLGWLLTRNFFVNELESIWPTNFEGWDHLRRSGQSQ